MRRASNEAMVLVALGGLLAAGVLVDFAGRPPQVDSQSAPTGARFESYTAYCPPALQNGEANLDLTVSALEDEPIHLGLEPARDETRLLDPEGIVTFSEPDGQPLNVVGYGGQVTASAVTGVQSPVEGLGAAACAHDAATDWFFADGSSALRYDERLLVYNPFPDEAVVRVTLYTKAGPKDKANLSEVAVPAQSSVGIKLNDFVRLQRLLSVRVSAVRGRVVVWKALLAEPEQRPSGVQFTLGATEVAPEWFFPEGWIGERFDERIALLNPGDEESVVTISLTTDEGTVQPPRLVEVAVAPQTAKLIRLNEVVTRAQRRQLAGVGVVVRSSNDVGLIAERTIWYEGEGLTGVTDEIGATHAALVWVVGPAAMRSQSDSLTLLNPDAEDAQVTIRLLRVGRPPIEVHGPGGVTVGAGSRFKIPLVERTKGKPMVAIIESDRPIVVERTSYSGARGDFSALMGRALE